MGLRIMNLIGIAIIAAGAHALARRPTLPSDRILFLGPNEFLAIASSSRTVLVSVDEPADFQLHRIPGAVCFSDGIAPAGATHVAVYSSCCVGRATPRIRQLQHDLDGSHRTLVVLAGGLAAWQMAGLPVEGTHPDLLKQKAAYASLDQLVRFERFALPDALERLRLEEAMARASTAEERGRVEAELAAFRERSAVEAARVKGRSEENKR